MIRINLLPSKKKKKAFALPPALIYGIAAVVVVTITVIAGTLYLNKQVSSKQEELTAKEQKLKKLQAALEEVKNYEKDNKDYREKTRIIETLKKNQIVPLRLLDEVSEMLPKGVWLTSLTDKGGIISIEGYAFTNSDLVNYVQNLKGSKYFTEVMLVESRQTQIEEFTIYKFSLTFKITV
ncbi:MAG: PilN domain-containing protein [Nitrospirae bacterium]|nr:PilN domain-containing protein [Nitrospirota bacterium]